MTYTDLSSINQTIEGFLQYPALVDKLFYVYILTAFFMIIALASFFEERRLYGKGNMLSSFAISSIGTIIISVFMLSLGLFTLTYEIMILTICLFLIVLWILKK